MIHWPRTWHYSEILPKFEQIKWIFTMNLGQLIIFITSLSTLFLLKVTIIQIIRIIEITILTVMICLKFGEFMIHHDLWFVSRLYEFPLFQLINIFGILQSSSFFVYQINTLGRTEREKRTKFSFWASSSSVNLH